MEQSPGYSPPAGMVAIFNGITCISVEHVILQFVFPSFLCVLLVHCTCVCTGTLVCLRGTCKGCGYSSFKL